MILTIPEDLLEEFVRFLEASLGTLEVPDTEKAQRLKDHLSEWVGEKRLYLKFLERWKGDR